MAQLYSNLDQSEAPRSVSRLKPELTVPCLATEQADQALSPEERRLFTHIFSIADSDNLGVITGDVAIRFFPDKARLPSETLGEVSYLRTEHAARGR